MVKSNMMLSIDSELYELIKKKYPKQISSIVEDYLRGMLNLDIPDLEQQTPDQLNEDLEIIESELIKLKIKRDAMRLEKEKKEKAIEEWEMKDLNDRIAVHKAMLATGEMDEIGNNPRG